MSAKLVPKLRFPEFFNDMELVALDNLVHYQKGFAFKSEDYIDGGVRVIRSSDISGTDVNLDGTVHVSEKSIFSCRRYLIEQDSIIVATVGSKPNLTESAVGRAIFVKRSDLGLLNQNLVMLRPVEETSIGFLYFQFLRKRYQSYIWKIQRGNANQSNIAIKDLLQFSFRFPTLPEQKKIADFLGSVDKKLNKLRRKHELLTTYKCAAMQQIFSQKIRFKTDTGEDFPDWEYRELGEVFEYEQPTSYLVSNTEYSENYSIPVLTAGKTFILGYTNETNGVFACETPVVIFDDFTTSCQFVDFAFKAKSSAMKILKPRNKAIPIKLYYEFLNQMKSTAGDHKRHWISEFQYKVVPFPCLEEQQKIAEFLSSIDTKIDAVSKQITQIEIFKKGLLQQMFV